jgi:hypothetical protein
MLKDSSWCVDTTLILSGLSPRASSRTRSLTAGTSCTSVGSPTSKAVMRALTAAVNSPPPHASARLENLDLSLVERFTVDRLLAALLLPPLVRLRLMKPSHIATEALSACPIF